MLKRDFFLIVTLLFVILMGCNRSKPLSGKQTSQMGAGSSIDFPPSNPAAGSSQLPSLPSPTPSSQPSNCLASAGASFFIQGSGPYYVNTDIRFVVEVDGCDYARLIPEPGATPLLFSGSILFTRRFSTAGSITKSITLQILGENSEILLETALLVSFTITNPPPSPTPSTTPVPNSPTCNLERDKELILEGEEVTVTLTHTNPSQSGILTGATVNGINVYLNTPTKIKPPAGTTLVLADVTSTTGLHGTCSKPIQVKLCGGRPVAGSCWYLASSGQSCSDFCSDHGGYLEATSSFAGSKGTNANCKLVFDALGVGGSSVADYAFSFLNSFGRGLGCELGGDGVRYRVTYPSTNSNHALPGTQRVCACDQ